MEKKRSSKKLWLLLLASMLAGIVYLDVSGAATILHYYLMENPQKELVFSFSPCSDANNISKNTVVSQRWEGNSLVVSGVAFPNCGAIWLFGSYDLDGTALSLKYLPVESSVLTACECSRNVRFNIDDLNKGDYTVSISKGRTVEFKPFIYSLLFGE